MRAIIPGETGAHQAHAIWEDARSMCNSSLEDGDIYLLAK
jgi:hypothetical protein